MLAHLERGLRHGVVRLGRGGHEHRVALDRRERSVQRGVAGNGVRLTERALVRVDYGGEFDSGGLPDHTGPTTAPDSESSLDYADVIPSLSPKCTGRDATRSPRWDQTLQVGRALRGLHTGYTSTLHGNTATSKERHVEYRSLGRTGVKVSELCLGCMMFGGRTGDDDSADIIDRAVDSGINFLDTANVYSRGASEEAVGKALERNGKRDAIVLATKVHGAMDEDDPNAAGNHRRHIVEQCDASLR